MFKSSNTQVKVESPSSTCPVCGLVIYPPKRKANDPYRVKKPWTILVYLSGSQLVVTGDRWAAGRKGKNNDTCKNNKITQNIIMHG